MITVSLTNDPGVEYIGLFPRTFRCISWSSNMEDTVPGQTPRTYAKKKKKRERERKISGKLENL